MFSWDLVVKYFPKIIKKLPLTFEIVAFSFIAGLIIGSVVAFIRIKKIPVFSQLVAVYISYMRGTPVICQMYVVYFGIPSLLKYMGSQTAGLDNIWYVMIAFSLNMGGFMGETIRSSIIAVPADQTEAGTSMGLTGFQTLWHVVLPQAIRIGLPQLGTTLIHLFNATALAYLVGVMDMLGKARSLASISGHSLEGYVCCAFVFALISLTLERIMAVINNHLDFGRSRKAG